MASSTSATCQPPTEMRAPYSASLSPLPSLTWSLGGPPLSSPGPASATSSCHELLLLPVSGGRAWRHYISPWQRPGADRQD